MKLIRRDSKLDVKYKSPRQQVYMYIIIIITTVLIVHFLGIKRIKIQSSIKKSVRGDGYQLSL